MLFEDQTFRTIVENLCDGVYIVDLNRKITFWNKAAENISGYTAEEVVGRSCSDNLLTHVSEDGCNLCKGLCPLAFSMKDGLRREALVFLHHKEGYRVPVQVRVSPVFGPGGEVLGGVEIFTQANQAVATQEQVKELERMALIDTLTQIPNRNYLERELRMLIEERKRFKIEFGVLFVDIDRFKVFNDTWGHNVGDVVLKSVAKTITLAVRPFDLFGRWGGEEFLGIIRYADPAILKLVGERVRNLVESSYFEHEGIPLRVTISLGGSLIQDQDTPESIVGRADSFLYQSKNEGRNRVTVGKSTS